MSIDCSTNAATCHWFAVLCYSAASFWRADHAVDPELLRSSLPQLQDPVILVNNGTGLKCARVIGCIRSRTTSLSCWLTRRRSRSSGPNESPPASVSVDDILLVRLRLIGDVVFTTPPSVPSDGGTPPRGSLPGRGGGCSGRSGKPHLMTYRDRRPIGIARLVRILRSAGGCAPRDTIWLSTFTAGRELWLTWATGAPVRIGFEVIGRSWSTRSGSPSARPAAPPFGPEQWICSPRWISHRRIRARIQPRWPRIRRPPPGSIAVLPGRRHARHQIVVVHVTRAIRSVAGRPPRSSSWFARSRAPTRCVGSSSRPVRPMPVPRPGLWTSARTDRAARRDALLRAGVRPRRVAALWAGGLVHRRRASAARRGTTSVPIVDCTGRRCPCGRSPGATRAGQRGRRGWPPAVPALRAAALRAGTSGALPASSRTRLSPRPRAHPRARSMAPAPRWTGRSDEMATVRSTRTLPRVIARRGRFAGLLASSPRFRSPSGRADSARAHVARLGGRLVVRRERFNAPRMLSRSSLCRHDAGSAAFSTDPRASFVDSKQLALFLAVPMVYQLPGESRARRCCRSSSASGRERASASSSTASSSTTTSAGARRGARPLMTYSASGADDLRAQPLLFSRDRAWPALMMPPAGRARLTFTRSAWVGACVSVALC